jgi:monofunctional biosynthetic peptidoglycan transglycosylase
MRWMRRHPVRTGIYLLLGYVIIELATIPYFDIWRLRNENPPETALMRQRIDEARREGETLRLAHEWIPLNRIPRHVIDAVIVAEDGTFFTHGGVDWFEVQESVRKDLEKGRAVRGASTITQQLAKNLFLSTSKDPVRKLKELLITVLMEQALTKQRILELYLNEIEWGRGIFGIEAASETYFGRSAAMLSLDEAARLAAVIPSPLVHRPDAESRYVTRRKMIVLGRMAARRMLAGEQRADSGLEAENPIDQIPGFLPTPLGDSVIVDDDTTEIENEGTNGL